MLVRWVAVAGIVVIGLFGIFLGTLHFIVKEALDPPGQVAVSDYFIDGGAELSEMAVHESFRRYLQAMSRNEKVPAIFISGFPLLGHRVKEGSGTVISFRKFLNLGGPLTDQSFYEKLTIFLPPGMALGDTGSIDIASTADIVAFWSQGSSDFPHFGGCTGYADGGEINYGRSNEDWLYVSIDLSIGFVDLEETDCRPFAYSEEWMFERRDAGSLTPWEGGSTGGEGYAEGFPGAPGVGR